MDGSHCDPPLVFTQQRGGEGLPAAASKKPRNSGNFYFKLCHPQTH